MLQCGRCTNTDVILECYCRRETSVEKAIVEMKLVGVSTGRIEDVSESLLGAPVSSGTASDLNERRGPSP